MGDQLAALKIVSLSTEDGIATVSTILQDMRVFCENSEEAQLSFGFQDGILISEIVRILTEANTTSSTSKVDVISTSLWTLCRLCRRQMDKSTACVQNLNLVITHFDSIISVAREHIAHAEVAHPTCWLIMVLASDSEDRQMQLAVGGAVEFVLDVLPLHQSDATVTEFACRAVRNLSILDDITNKLVDGRVCEILAPIFASYVDSRHAAVVEACLWAVVNISCDEQFAAQLGFHGNCEPTVSAMACLLDVESVVFAAVSALRNLSSREALNFNKLAEAHVCPILLNAMRTHAESTRIVDSALWCLSNLACDEKMSVELLDLDVPSVLRAVRTTQQEQSRLTESPYISFGPIAEAILWAVRNLAGASGSNKARLGEAGMLPVVTEVLDTYVDRPGMVELALAACHNLCSGLGDNKLRLREQGALPGIIAALKTHASELEVMEEGLKLLATLCRDDIAMCHELNSLGVLALALEAVFSRVGEPLIFRGCCEIVLELVVRPDPSRLAEVQAAGLLDPAAERALPPSGKFHTMVAQWQLEALAEAHGVDLHRDDWDPAVMKSATISLDTALTPEMLRSLLASGAGEVVEEEVPSGEGL